ncbi:MAG: ATP-binding protein [Atopobiaceae bacterium]|jgi:predicted AAA+ superfamily ATPase|nr:ATP-binding protein [Atopobiaceae bacterium]MCH4180262.1 ATP-binding protein [Atopobiaceae bacterium]MCH4214748.1 ATP-binding protein [Atopobiaceae bacterium]MCH4229974.1 ATP-binding protein [Atopobiaceae bacterium]MCH4276943.1 ATP-binding protein [Atopobiaceae bacterium]
MYHKVSKLLLYSDLGEDSVLVGLSDIFRDWEAGTADHAELVRRAHVQVKHILDIATTYGFDQNLWQDYLTFVLLTNENSFTLTAERRGAAEGGSVNHFAKADLEVFRELFHFDFAPIEHDLGLDCFSVLEDYHAITKPEKNYYRSVSELVRRLSDELAAAPDVDAMFDALTASYKAYGVGMFGLNRAFHIHGLPDGTVQFLPINNIGGGRLSDLVGYEDQKKQLTDNTDAFVAGLPANNVLLYGDAGTGKSTSVKALVNEYYDSGLRMIEIYKHQFKYLSAVIAAIKGRNYRFVIYIDDLSFDEGELEYKFLKAVIEGGVETRPDNILIYATSNRRHLVKEDWKDRTDMEYEGDMHRSDTMQEKLSLAARFGVAINFSSPRQQAYHEIVQTLASRQLTDPPEPEQLLLLADRWELRHGGMSGRVAQQFVDYLAGQEGTAEKDEA